MLEIFSNDESVQGTRTPKFIGSYRTWVSLKIDVRGNSNIWIARDKETLQQNRQQQQGGIPIATADGVKEYWWVGDLFAIAAQANVAANFEPVGEGAPIHVNSQGV